jgi:hypothetical protein
MPTIEQAVCHPKRHEMTTKPAYSAQPGTLLAAALIALPF